MVLRLPHSPSTLLAYFHCYLLLLLILISSMEEAMETKPLGSPNPVGSPEGKRGKCRLNIPEQFMHKNKLQEYTQKSAIPHPQYHTVNHGFLHAPEYISSVTVDNTTYTSPNKFLQRKQAEQDVARLALECISRKVKDEGCSLTAEQIVICKSILYELACKRKLEKPTYTTQQSEEKPPTFVSSVVFNDQVYTGSVGKNKKEAEQSAARTAIQYILANTDTDTSLREIIRSKARIRGTQECGTSNGPIGNWHLDVQESSMSGSGSHVHSIIEDNIYTESPIVQPSLGDHSAQGIVGDVASGVKDLYEKSKKRKIHDEQLFQLPYF